MESKYYVPSIEEFRVGFQYEELMGTESSGLQDWSEKIFDISEYIDRNGEHYLLELINGECIRVNYLDQSDIESLGFTNCNDENGIRFKKENSTSIVRSLF